MVLYTSRARTLLYQGQPAEALPWLTKALPLALKGKRNAYYLSSIYRLLAQVSLEQNHLDRAKAAASDALKLVETAGNQEHVAAAQATLAQIYAAQGDAAAAKAMYRKALTLFEQVGILRTFDLASLGDAAADDELLRREDRAIGSGNGRAAGVDRTRLHVSDVVYTSLTITIAAAGCETEADENTGYWRRNSVRRYPHSHQLALQ